MPYRAIYAYAWDLFDAGVTESLAAFAELGLDTVTLACAYHAGKFLRPHGKRGKVYFPEDGTVYFRPTPARYGAIKPIENSLLKDRDPLREIAAAGRLQANAWLVLLHNTRLGTAHPDSTVENAFGDRYIYSLCPSAPEARALAVGLAHDVTESYAVRGVSLETPGFLPYAHGYHHEFALNRPNAWLDAQLGLCFCRHCLEGASRVGVRAEALRRRVAEDVEAYLASDIDFAPDMAEAFWRADALTDGDLRAFLDYRCNVVTSLVAEIRARVRADAEVAVIPSVARPTAGAWYEGSDLSGLAKAAGVVEACLYEPGGARVKADLFDIQRRLRGQGRLRGILRPAYPDLETKADFLAAMRALGEAGVKDVAFYNWGHVRASHVAWIGEGLAQLGS